MELISKDEVLKVLDEAWINGTSLCDASKIKYDVKALPSIEERKEGEWNYTDDLYETFYCSVCGFDTENYIYYNYCPNCGAKLKGANDDYNKR